jgi:hypothetical protein
LRQRDELFDELEISTFNKDFENQRSVAPNHRVFQPGSLELKERNNHGKTKYLQTFNRVKKANSQKF